MLRITLALLVVVAIAWLVLLSAFDNKSARGETLSYAELPPDYLFLLFPKKDCERIRAVNSKCPDRAMLVAKEEFESGFVRFSDAQVSQYMINSAALEFVPVGNAELMLKKWHAVLPNVSDYSNAEWKVVLLKSGNSEIRLTLHDSVHARQDYFIYFVKDGIVTGAQPMTVFGVFDLVLIAVLALLAAGIIWLADHSWRKSR